MKKSKSKFYLIVGFIGLCFIGFCVDLSVLLYSSGISADETKNKMEQTSIIGKWKFTIFKVNWLGRRGHKIITSGTITFDDATFEIIFNNLDGQPNKANYKGTYSISHPKRSSYMFWITLVRPEGWDFTCYPLKLWPNAEPVEKSDFGEDSWEFTKSFISGGYWCPSCWVFERIKSDKIEDQKLNSFEQIKKGVEIRIGMSEDEVINLLGVPNKKAVLGEKTIYQYSDTVITFIKGKVSDIQFK